MFKICLYQLRQAFSSPRIYIALLIGSVMQIISCIPLFDFAKMQNQPLCIFEGFIYFNCDTYIASAAFLGIILLVSDIPFSSQNETYILMRISRKKWVYGKVIYLFLSCVLYYLVVFLVGAIFISENAYIGNVWSRPIYYLAKDSSSSLAVNYNVYFPYKHILLGLSPFSAMTASFFLSVLYAFLMSLIIFLLNLNLSRPLSYGIAMLVHIIGYLLAALFSSYFYMKFSLLGNSLLMYHDIKGYYKGKLFTTIPQSIFIFIVLSIIILFLILKSIKNYDFRTTAGAKR
ncbi:MAG TPA: hypothetical protein PLM59_01250 [Oscillospiraceae bacterium]|nr:hypothetical protein [Oscillospiraceae bacterium]